MIPVVGKDAVCPEPYPWRQKSLWLGGASWAVCDQGVWSLSNFLLNLYLVKTFGPHKFGVYSVAFSVYLVLSAVQNSLLLEPMSVVFADAESGISAEWTTALRRIQLFLGLGGGMIFAVAALPMFWISPELAPCMLAQAVTFPVVTAVLYGRRLAYMELVPARSAVAGVINLVSVFCGAVFLRRFDYLTPAAAFLCMGIGALLSMMMLRNLAGLRREQSPDLSRDTTAAWAALWDYGKWSLSTTATGLFGSVLYPPLLAATAGYEAAGAYRAMEYVFLPASQALTALCTFSLPRLSATLRIEGLIDSKQICTKYVTALTSFALIYGVTAYILFRSFAAFVLGATYLAGLWMIPFLSFNLVMRALGDAGIGIVLRAVLRPNATFVASVCGALIVAAVGYPLSRLYGTAGLLYGTAGSGLIQLAVYIWFLSRELAGPNQRPQVAAA